LLEVSDYGSSTTTNCFAAFDGNGNLAALVNAANGTTLANYEYGPFGEVIRATGPMAKANPFRFSTKYLDDESDLLYYGYRYYKPSTGTWLSRDPINEYGFYLMTGKKNKPNRINEENSYGFVGNDPVVIIDNLGLAVCECTMRCRTCGRNWPPTMTIFAEMPDNLLTPGNPWGQYCCQSATVVYCSTGAFLWPGAPGAALIELQNCLWLASMGFL